MSTPRIRTCLLALAAVTSAIAVAGCGSNANAPTTHPDADIIKTADQGSSQAAGGAPDGKAIFASAGCASCHTFAPAGAKGTIGPDLAEISKEGAAPVREAIVDPNVEILKGYKKGVMPTDFGTKLSKAELAALVKFMVDAGNQGASQPAAAAPDGKAIFASAGCASCHTFAPAGAKGTIGPDLAEISKEGTAPVMDAIVDPNAEILKGYKKGIMPTDFGTKLSKAELAALVKFMVDAGKK